MDYETLTLERPEDAPGLLVVSLNRPERLNATNPQMEHDLQQVCRELQEDGSVRVVMLTGTGRAFSSGADIKRDPSPEGYVPPPGTHAKGDWQVASDGAFEALEDADLIRGLDADSEIPDPHDRKPFVAYYVDLDRLPATIF